MELRTILASIGALVEALKKANRLDLVSQITDTKGQVVEAYEQMVNLMDENRQLRATNEELKRRLDAKAALAFRYPVYWSEGDETPFCALCWETKEKAVHLRRGGNETRYFCTACKSDYFTGDRTIPDDEVKPHI